MAAPGLPLPPPPPGDPGMMDMGNPFGGGMEALPPMAEPGSGSTSPDTIALLDALVQQRLMEVTAGMDMGGPPMGGPPMGGPPMGGPPMGPPPLPPMGAEGPNFEVPMGPPPGPAPIY